MTCAWPPHNLRRGIAIRRSIYRASASRRARPWIMGRGYNVIDLLGWKAGFLICYDNNLPENVRITTMMGAQMIFMPHVTGCLPSPMPGRGSVDPKLWENRHRDPAPLRLEFAGAKAK